MKMRALLLGATMVLAATAAFATVTFDPNTGTGFVGKGDVQLAFGWNNAMVQANATGVSFEYDSSATYDVTIEFDTGNSDHNVTHHTLTQNKATAVNDQVVSSMRTNTHGDLTGFNLTGLGTPIVTGDAIPNVGDPCPNGNLGTCTVTAVTLISGGAGGLYVVYGGNKVLLGSF